jgi:hypothetical protein
MNNDSTTNATGPVGYDALIARYGLQVMPHWHHSAISRSTTRQTQNDGGTVLDVYPRSLAPQDTLGGQLEFALKYDGVSLDILAALFAQAEPDAVVAYIRSKPLGKYTRRIWYLYELLTGNRLPLEDITSGNYIDLLEKELYYTSAPVQARRQRVNDNLLGDARFCPIVRRTELLQAFEKKDLPRKCHEVLSSYPREILKRALSYLYTKETKSSFEIEKVSLDATRTERFVALLVLAEKKDFFNKKDLIELQNRIVDTRFQDPDYRQSQNYVGESITWTEERVHFIPPKPADLRELMEGMYAAHVRMGQSGLQPVVHAAAVAFGFVFMHPFEDGNGRIHRFLIHNILAYGKFTPPGVIFPVSAAMLNDPDAYDAALEAFSKGSMALVEYELDETGRLTVKNDTARHYRYIDMTVQAEALFGFIERVIGTDLVAELMFLRNYDATKKALQEIVDMPDRMIDLFIRLCLQNKGVLSAAKRRSLFEKLSDDEVTRMEAAVRKGYSDDGLGE